MKQFSILLTILLWAFSVYGEYTTVPITVSGSTEIPANSILFADDNLSVSTVYATKAGASNYIYDDEGTDISFNEWIQIRVSELPSADFPYGGEQSGSTPVVITANKAMILKSYVRTGSTKSIMLYDDTYVPIESHVSSEEDYNSDKNSFFVTSWQISPGTYVLLEQGGTGRLSGLAYEVVDGSFTRLKAPILSQQSCEFYQSFELTISDINEPAATIYYTMDGSIPSAENGTKYTAPITIPIGNDVTVKALSVSGDNISPVTTAIYRYIAKHLFSVKIPNKNGLNYIYYSSNTEYGEWYDDNSAYITEGDNLYIGFSLNTGYKCKDIKLNGVSQNASGNSFSFIMPNTDVELIVDVAFDPSSPSDPQPGETSKKYNLYLTSNPIGACSLSGAGTYSAGSEVYLYASSQSGYVFTGWTKDGETISTNRSFRYTMPSSDVVLTANYIFNPSSPSDPQQPTLKHPLTVIASPAGAGSFSISSSEVTYGQEYYVYAYPQTGYKFKGWIVNGVAQESTSTQLTGIMTESGAHVVGLFVFDPSSPSNPGANYYNATTGQVIIDDFSQGNFYSALRDVVGYDNFGNVSNIIVKGRMSSDDYGTLSYLTNAVTIDLSRTGGVTTVPGYAFQDLTVANILLPSTITNLGNYIFRNCSNLTSLTIYAQEPPKCSSYTFSGLTKDNCTVFVPAEAIELYTTADYWKDFTVLPITDDAHVLQVNLPADAIDGRYKNNSIELVNLNSGVRQKYVISDRLLYTFNGLRKDEQYNIYMLSPAGLELSRIENVTVPDTDFEVTFEKLKSVYTVNAIVLTPDGKDVTSDVTVEWLNLLDDGTTTYLRKATSLGEIPEGQALICRVTLNNQIGTVYAMPEDTEFTVNNEQNTCTVTLAPFRSIALSGNIVDGDGTALSGASVSVNQTLNGKYSKSYTAKTDRQGKWSLTVLDAPETRLTYAATECVNVNDTIGAFEPEISTLDLGKTVLKSIVGARVTYGFTYHAAGSEDIQDYYSDYQNVLVSVFNVTQNRAHNDVSLQYPILAVLDENINTGDELRLTATSKTGAFNPMVETVTVGENQRAEVTFDIVGKGGIQAAFEMTDNPAVIAILYSSKGELLKKQTYSEAQTRFTNLEDGDYTLVSMGQSDLMNSILRLSSFSEIGLTEGKDYVKNAVKVESGKLSEVKNSEIPAFDESLFYYTNSSTSFSSNKSSITTGNYLTLRAAIDFKGVYKNDISNVALVVDLPEACDFVEQSVIQGPNLLPYTIDNNRLTIQLGNAYTAQTRFCVIPTSGGSFNATASIVFDYNGKTLTQPIGSAASEIKDIEIIVPNIIASNTFKVTGTSLSNSVIKVFGDNVLIGLGKANAAGLWNIDCELDKPYNLSTHDVYAKITTPADITLTSETKCLTYDMNAVRVSKVTMYHWNPEINGWKGNMETSVFDFLNPNTIANQWTVYYPKKVFTYTIEFTANNPDRISNVILYVHTADGKIVPCNAEYDNQKQLWYAELDMGSSSNSYYPVNCSVDFDYDSELVTSRDALYDQSIDSDYINEINNERYNRVNSIVLQMNELDIDDTKRAKLWKSLYNLLDIEYDNVELPSIRDEELCEFANNLLLEIDDYENENSDMIWSEINNLESRFYQNLSDFGSNGFVSVSNCNEVNVELLIENGFDVYYLDDGTKVYLKEDGITTTIVDPYINRQISLNVNIPLKVLSKSEQSPFSRFWDSIVILRNTISTFANACGDIQNQFNKYIQNLEYKLVTSQRASELLWSDAKNCPFDDLKIKWQTTSIHLDERCNRLTRQIELARSSSLVIARIASRVLSLMAIVNDAISLYNELINLSNLVSDVPSCPNHPDRSLSLINRINALAAGKAASAAVNIGFDIAAINSAFMSVAAAPATGGASLTVTLATFTGTIAKAAIGVAIDFAFRRAESNIRSDIANLAKDSSCTKCGGPYTPPCPDDDTDNGDK